MLKLRSIYIMKKIIANLKVNKNLQLMKYNKTIQNKLNISILDYKKYNEIEIELKLENKKDSLCKVISTDENDKSYIHIYVDNNKSEVNDNYIENKDNITKIKIKIDFEKKSLKGLFKNCDYIQEINFIKFNRKDIIDISEMFYECKSLIKLNLLNLKTNNVTNMAYLFYGCSSLEDINLSNFNTSNVKGMQYMFEKCSKLKSLDLNTFNTEKTVNMNDMFNRCKSLKNINISNFNTTNVINMSYMFYECSSLEDLNLISFDTSKVIDMSYMFYNCDKIKKLNLSKFSTSNVINMSNMFENCKNLNDLDISNFEIKNNIRVKYMFSNCQNILKNKIKAQFLNINNDAFDDNFRTDLYSFNSLCDKEISFDLNPSDLNEDNYYFPFENEN